MSVFASSLSCIKFIIGEQLLLCLEETVMMMMTTADVCTLAFEKGLYQTAVIFFSFFVRVVEPVFERSSPDHSCDRKDVRNSTKCNYYRDLRRQEKKHSMHRTQHVL